jgi:hypothetical protein
MKFMNGWLSYGTQAFPFRQSSRYGSHSQSDAKSCNRA